jgi:acetyl esterase/lipase
MKLCKKTKYLPACIILFSVMFPFISGCKPPGAISPETIMDISYGPDKENIMDASLPQGRTEETPAIILIHGGAWTGGDKRDFSFLRGYFSRKGFAAFSINYRLARVAGTGIRNILEDMDYAVAFIKDKSGAWTFSQKAVFLAGHSAGGHIALLYSFSRIREDSIRGVVSYCGFGDLTDPELETFLFRMDNKENFINGKGIEPPSSIRPFDRIGFVAGRDMGMRIAYSPQSIIGDVPVILFCGKMDEIIPWRQSETLHKKMKERGFDSTLYVYPDMGHDITPHYGEIMKITEKWIRERI